jgi:hypothetical protein
LTAYARTLGEVSARCDANHARAKTTQWGFSTQVRASSSQPGQFKYLGRALEERETLLCLQETDLEVRETILAEEMERGLHPSDRRDLSVELNTACTRVVGIDGERVAEAE